MTNYEEHKSEMLKDPDFRHKYEKSKPKYERISRQIKKKLEKRRGDAR